MNRHGFLCQALKVVVVVCSLLATAAHAAPVSVTVPGVVQPLKQPSDMACWATVATIIYSWKNKTSMGIKDVMAAAGPKYEALFASNGGLRGIDKPAFLNAMGGLKNEGPQNYTVAGWAKLLSDYGPLWVTTDEGSSGNFAVHARVLTAIKGDGTPNGTLFTIVDPTDGKIHSETVSEFVKKFEQVAKDEMGVGAELRPQVVHY
jgi:hypothetical protein